VNLEIVEEPMAVLAEHARVPIAFEVRSILDVETGRERPIAIPYVRDFGPATMRWAEDFDVSRWGLLAARSQKRRVGGAVIAFDTPGVDMLEGRNDLAVLWDIRVSPEVRGAGVGSALFRAVEGWASGRGCRQLKIETQNTNVAACRFYQRQGCFLGGMHRGAYPDDPDEVQLLWYKSLPGTE
jgi:ribosomal protein S18 acetylase RimI-like enzyme